ncbi:hypothetical protein VNO78_34809 [Psophocarpus tetragonolobus]|uniref:Uncharacterized protein n=1 Tax=Psophocarpus tetragonolobus TaxID=3891 RepID=A0AAN9NV25_PSOTE
MSQINEYGKGNKEAESELVMKSKSMIIDIICKWYEQPHKLVQPKFAFYGNGQNLLHAQAIRPLPNKLKSHALASELKTNQWPTSKTENGFGTNELNMVVHKARALERKAGSEWANGAEEKEIPDEDLDLAGSHGNQPNLGRVGHVIGHPCVD